MTKRAGRGAQFGVIVLMLLLWSFLILAVAQRQAILDWWKLRGYTPSAAVSGVATTDTMTVYARHLFYVNKPALISNRSTFAADCPVNVEKTIVLGCYKPNDTGIYLYNVTDPRLQGVAQVTAAHEMLHAAYERLTNADRAAVDAMLLSYYRTGLKDQRLLDTFAAYKAAGADVTNEMHSILGTEVAQLPAPLENYYRRYFANRQQVIAEETRYEAEFTSREARVATYDSQLKNVKQTVDDNKILLDQRLAELSALETQMNGERAAGDNTAYNADVVAYNAKVDAYNALLRETKSSVDQYNQLVDARNSVATEEKQLVQALSGNSLPASK